MNFLTTILPFVPFILLAVVIIAVIASGYVKAPPDTAYIISGFHKEPRILIGNKYHAYFDFYIENKYLIEYDGEQHFNYKNEGWNIQENFNKTKERDLIKNQWCKQNNIPLIRIPYWKLDTLKLDDLILETSQYIVH